MSELLRFLTCAVNGALRLRIASLRVGCPQMYENLQ